MGKPYSMDLRLAAVRRRGYALTLAPRPQKLIGLAVPVRQGRQMLACLVMFPEFGDDAGTGS